MTRSDQLKSLFASHLEGEDERFWRWRCRLLLMKPKEATQNWLENYRQ